MNDDTAAPRVFISHRYQDMDRAVELALAIRARGIPVWLDKWEVLPGDNIVKMMEQALAAAKIGLVLLSNTGMGVGWMSEEFAALLRAVVEKGGRIIPVLLDPDAPVPTFLKHRAAVAGDDLDGLERALTERRGPPPDTQRAGPTLAKQGKVTPPPIEVFVAVHPGDFDILKEVTVHLKMLTLSDRDVQYKFWDQSKGKQFLAEERQAAVLRARKAIVLVSTEFLVDDDLPKDIVALLEAEVPLYCLYVNSANAHKVPFEYFDRRTSVKRKRYLTDIKPVNEPDRPLRAISRHERDQVYANLVEALER